MAKSITTKKIAFNLIISVLAQAISLIVTFVLYLIVPKFIPKLEYSYWQIYMLYAGQVTIFHFGIIDGLILRYSQYDYEELDKERIRSQFKFILVLTSIFTVIAVVAGIVFCGGATRIIVVFVAVSIITKNIILYTSSTFQLTNRISKYTIFIIIQKLSYGIFVTVLLICKVQNFYLYCIGDLFGDAIAIAVALFLNKGMYFGRSIRGVEIFKETKLNIISGVMLMIANYSVMFLTSGAKMIVQWHWDEIIFSEVSFAFSVTSLFLTFVAAMGPILFPSLKRVEEENLPEMYKNIRGMISPVLFLALLFYFPGCWILNKWLPNYSESLPYLGVLLPLIIFSSKVSLLTNNYLKVFRKEKLMLIINLASAAVGLSAFILCAYVFDSLTALLICVVAVIMLNSVVSEIFVSRIIKKSLILDFIIESIMTVGFIVIVKLLDLKYGCIAYACAFLLYCAVNYKYLVSLFRKLFKKKKKLAKSPAEIVEDITVETDEHTD